VQTQTWKNFRELLASEPTRQIGAVAVARFIVRGTSLENAAETLGTSVPALKRTMRQYPDIEDHVNQFGAQAPGPWITLPGELKPMRLGQALRHQRLSRATYKSRRAAGLSIEEALTRPVQSRRAAPIEWNGETLTIAQWARKTGLPLDTIRKRRARNWPPERIFEPARHRATAA
jgi:hypothetical protein